VTNPNIPNKMAEKVGFLTKEGGSYRSWKRRWCVLKNGCLIYSKNQKGEQLGSIDLHTAGNIETTTARPNKKNCFHIVTPKRDYHICADSESERDSWIKELSMERDRVQGKLKPPPASSSAGANNANHVQKDPKKVELSDFETLCVIGKGSFGKVMQVKKKDTGKVYAMKILNKDKIVQSQELRHAKAEKKCSSKIGSSIPCESEL